MKVERKRSSHYFREDILKKLNAQCPFCGARYTPWKGKMIDAISDAELMHLQCTRCKGSVVALVMVSGHIISSIGLLTDLSLQDVRKFRSSERVNEDDVLELHTLLNQTKHISYEQ